MAFLGILALAWLPLQEKATLPKLPPALGADPQALAACEILERGGEAAERRSAAETLLKALEKAGPAERADYVMSLSGLGLVPPALDLQPFWSGLAQEWPELGPYVAGRLLQFAEPLRDPAPLKGAIEAAGMLRLAEPAVVECIAGWLKGVSAAAAYHALFRITGHEFLDQEDFVAWWRTAAGQPRSAWMEAAFLEKHGREVSLWQDKLAAKNEETRRLAVLEALRSTTLRVRELGLQTFATLTPPEPKKPGEEGAGETHSGTNGGATDDGAGTWQALVAALRERYEVEQSPALRERILSLIPRVLPGEEAVRLLERSMEPGRSEAERVQAVQALLFVPPELAAQSLKRRLLVIYWDVAAGGPAAQAALEAVKWMRSETLLPLDSRNFRGVLIDSWRSLAASTEAFRSRDEQLYELLLRALQMEREVAVREKLYAAIGALKWPGLFEVVHQRAQDPAAGAAERSPALDAMARLAATSDERAAAAGLLHALLVDPELGYRSIQCLRQLKDPASIPVLAARLALEPQDYLRLELLKALAAVGEAAELAELDSLLAYQAKEEERKFYRDALIALIGSKDPAKLLHAVARLEAGERYQLAFSATDAFPRASFSGEQQAELDETHLRILAKWLIKDGLDNGRAARVEGALAGLREYQAKEPEEWLWPYLVAGIELQRQQPLAAWEAYRAADKIGIPADFPATAPALAEQLKRITPPEQGEVVQENGDHPEAPKQPLQTEIGGWESAVGPLLPG